MIITVWVDSSEPTRWLNLVRRAKKIIIAELESLGLPKWVAAPEFRTQIPKEFYV